ncbi:hypothetical protein [Pseudomonas putida]|uniref:Uncharacterized protein n=1 Tax=Pseudomonas putida TaxID=303 RepID=A0A6I6XXC2_PSEPU|nr:hypothetical protein [Pseudomonas putida]QHG63929.2 hypothetical protein C2H86_05620 [Pseudomonas putida]
MSDSGERKMASEPAYQAFWRLLGAWRASRASEVDSGLKDLQVSDAMLADKSSGLVYSKYLKDPTLDLTVSVPAWFFSDKDTLRIEHTRDKLVVTTIHDELIEYYVRPIPDPYPIALNKHEDVLGVEGTHYFRSWIKADNDDISWSPWLPLIFDRVPPYNHAPPAKFPGIPAVTDASLAAGGGKVVLELPAYSDWADGDTAHIFWMNRLPEDFGDVDPPVVSVATTGKAQPVEIAEDKIRALGDGGVFVLYVLVDKAENVSELAVYTSIAVALGTLPSVFKDPIVPLATVTDGYLIDQADAHEGVEVWVPLYEGMKASDFVVVQWGATSLSPEMVGSAPGDHIRVRVPIEVLLKEYGTGPGAVPTTVRYTLLRGTHPMGGADTAINVDFETMDPGGTYPSWPVPIHPGLLPAVITGRGSNKTNELDSDDTDLPADLAVKLYSFVEESDELTFFWAGEVAATYIVQPGDKADDEITLEVPWRVIHEAGNGPAVPVDYEARRAGVHNPARSVITSVAVDAITITPVVATFDHLVNGLVSCATIKKSAGHPDGPAVEVLIPDLSEYLEYKPFTKVGLKWWVYRGRSEEQGSDIIDEVTLEDEFKLDDEHPVTGFTWRVPFDDHVLPTYEGSTDPNYTRSRANVVYTLKTDNPDDDTPSEDAKVTLAFIPPSGICDPHG